jgi:glycosyltransferase involved in cell wall biosynthesis
VKFVNPTIHRYLHKAAAVLVPSQTIAKNVRLTYGYKGKITILPFWVDQPDKSAPASNGRTSNLLYLGRFDADKGIESLCEAFRSVQRLHPRANLTICGDGDRALVKRLTTNNPSINVRGRVTGDEFEAVLRGCDAVVLPSLHEGYPLCLLEACARRKPIISTSVGSIPELFGGRLCALLIRPGDVHELARAMSRILSEDNSIYSARCSDAFDLFSSINSSSIIHQRLSEAYQ